MKKELKILFNNLLALIFFALIFSMFSEAISSNFKTLTDIIKEKPLISIFSYLSILSLALSSHSIKKLIYNRITHILNLSLCLSFFINYLSNGFTEDQWWDFIYILAYYLIYIGFDFLGWLIYGRNYVTQKKTKEEQEYPFLLDEPLDTKHESKISEDGLLKLKNKLLATKGISQSFVLGIIGAWGSGKTTLGKELHDSLENEHSKECSSIWFEPWKFKGENTVQDSLIEHLSPELPAQERAILKEYGDLLKHEAIPAFLKFFIDLVNHSNSENKFEKLKESLKKHGKQIYIFIDDLDRLDAKEILEVFKLIRSTLSLPQLSYVLIYDKTHIESVLESSSSQKNDSRNFLDKIVQVEYYMPSKGRMSDYFAEEFFGEFESKLSSGESKILNHLKSLLEVDSKDEWILSEEYLIAATNRFRKIFNRHILTIRDLKRLINNFRITITITREDWQTNDTEPSQYEIIFQFLLEILKTKYPKIYDVFYYAEASVLESSSSYHKRLYNQIPSGILENQYINQYSKKDQSAITELMTELFGSNCREDLRSNVEQKTIHLINTTVESERMRIIGEKFEEFANKNRFLCHTAHYKKYFGINKDQDNFFEEK
jgi:Cdc6-like AAA superfamily ATPase